MENPNEKRMNHEVTAQQLLLDDRGELREPGWSRRMVQQYRRDMIKAPRFRIKEWDYYLVMGDGFAGAFTISDDGYIGLQSVSLLLLDDRKIEFGADCDDEYCDDRREDSGNDCKEIPWEHSETILNVMPLGKLSLPQSSDQGTTHFENKRLWMDFSVTQHPETGEKCRHIMCSFSKFFEGKTLKADIWLRQPDMDSLVIATPWDHRHAFYYNQKINCMRASGYIEYDGRRYEFDPARDFGTLDWGRGVWTYDNTWYWGSGNADLDGHSFGFNIGYGFGNTAAASENVLFYDGHAHKLDDVTFNIPDNYMDKWTFTSSDGRFEMEFFPVLDRAAKLDFKVLISDQHQVFGRMSGTAILDDGTRLDIRDVMCFAEKVHNRY